MKTILRARGALGILTAFGLAGALSACSDLLTVNNPGQVDDADLNDSSLVAELGYSTVGSFHNTLALVAYAGAVLSDEAVSGHNFDEWQDVDGRIINDVNNGYGEYVRLHRTRFLASEAVGRIRGILGEAEADKSAAVAQALAIGGYATTLLGETYCESPLGGDQPASTPDQIFEAAIPVYEKAIAVATAANDQYSLNLARVALARTYLNMGNMAKAREFATPVPANFVAWARYGAQRSEFYNPFRGATAGQNFNLGVDPEFQALADPRVKFAAPRPGHNPSYPISRPYQPPSFSGYRVNDTISFADDTDIRIASGLEAQYIVAEANGGVESTRVFVNTRRASVGKAELAADATPAQIMAALRTERSLDFFMDAHRLGDLRRYKKLYGINEFSQGNNPNPFYGDYEDAECFIPTSAERIGNPSY